jgi:hypothetical protein
MEACSIQDSIGGTGNVIDGRGNDVLILLIGALVAVVLVLTIWLIVTTGAVDAAEPAHVAAAWVDASLAGP